MARAVFIPQGGVTKTHLRIPRMAYWGFWELCRLEDANEKTERMFWELAEWMFWAKALGFP